MSYRVTAGANAAHSKSHSKLHNHIIFVRICFLNENGGSGSVFYFKDYVTLITLSMSVPVHMLRTVFGFLCGLLVTVVAVGGGTGHHA